MIKKISFDDVKGFIKEAKKERVSFDNPKGAYWFGIYEDDKLVSFYCLVVKGKTARFKSNYTAPEYRRRGYLKRFIQHSKKICIKNNIEKMTAFCTPMSINSHLRGGAVRVSNKEDIIFVKYQF